MYRSIETQPKTPWARVLKHDAANRADGGPGYVDATNRARIERLISDTDPAQLTREVTAIQDELERLSRRRTEGMARRQGLDMGYSGKAIERMRADARQDNKQERRHRFALTSNDERTTVSRSLIYDKPRLLTKCDTAIASSCLRISSNSMFRSSVFTLIWLPLI